MAKKEYEVLKPMRFEGRDKAPGAVISCEPEDAKLWTDDGVVVEKGKRAEIEKQAQAAKLKKEIEEAEAAANEAKAKLDALKAEQKAVK